MLNCGPNYTHQCYKNCSIAGLKWSPCSNYWPLLSAGIPSGWWKIVALSLILDFGTKAGWSFDESVLMICSFRPYSRILGTSHSSEKKKKVFSPGRPISSVESICIRYLPYSSLCARYMGRDLLRRMKFNPLLRSSQMCMNRKITIQSNHSHESLVPFVIEGPRSIWTVTLRPLPLTLNSQLQSAHAVSSSSLLSWSPHWSPLEYVPIVPENWWCWLFLSKPCFNSRFKIALMPQEVS